MHRMHCHRGGQGYKYSPNVCSLPHFALSVDLTADPVVEETWEVDLLANQTGRLNNLISQCPGARFLLQGARALVPPHCVLPSGPVTELEERPTLRNGKIRRRMQVDQQTGYK